MKKRLALLIAYVIAVVLELLPFGAVCNFATPERTIRETFSYFDLVPFGYANFGPFLTAILTCVLLLLSLIYLFKEKNGLKKAITVLSLIAVVTSLMPLLFGISYFSVVGGLISLVLLAAFFLSCHKGAQK